MKIILVGDIMIGRLVNEMLKGFPPEYVWGTTLPLILKADVRIGNLECALTDTAQKWRTPKTFHFRSDKKNSAVLKAADITAVSLANNHTLDYGYEGLEETLQALDEIGLVHSGAGMDYDGAKEPAYLKTSKENIAFIAATDNEPEWEATLERPGTRYVPINLEDIRARLLFKQVAEVSSGAALVIVSLHWGANWGYEPPKEHKNFARHLIDAGAHIVYGHSPHVVRGVEWYKARPIIYSAGNFIDDYAVDEIEKNDETCIFEVRCAESVVEEIFIHPVIIKNMHAEIAAVEDAKRISRKMISLCVQLGTDARMNKKTGHVVLSSPAL